MSYKMIDLFAGCGGLEDGFLQSGKYEDIAAVEWLQPQVKTLINRLETKWGIKDAKNRVMCFDIQREDELFKGWSDDSKAPSREMLSNGKASRYKTGPYGDGKGLDHFVNAAGGIDIIIGGPPCQAYSVAGRVRDENGMKDDYRNYLFEHYLSVVNRYQPKVFVFENVPGLLSAMSDGTPIIQLIESGFSSIGYEIVDDVKKYAKVDASDYGVPQNRERLIILGIRKDLCEDVQVILHRFYLEILPKYKSKKKKTVAEAIGDLPKITPIINDEELKSRIGYSKPECHTTWHRARHHSLRDVEIYRMLANDIQSGRNEYVDSKSNGGRTRNLPEHDMDKWKLFKFYNQGDVEVEQSIQKKLVNYPVPDFVWEEFWLDQEINARGIQLDLTMVENAISLDEISKEKLVAAMREITDLDNPNSVAQMKVWLAEQGVEAESLGKKDVAKLMDEVEGDVKDALLLRQ